MTRLQLDYAKYLEDRRHDLASEAQAANELSEAIRTHQVNEGISRRNVANSERYTSSQIEAAKASIRQADRSLDLKESQQNWQQQIDRFNANLQAQKNNIEKDKLVLDKDKFANGKTQWNAEYAQKRKEYDLAVKQFKLDKTDKTWKNVLSTSKELRAWIEPASAVVSAAAKAVVKATSKSK